MMTKRYSHILAFALALATPATATPFDAASIDAATYENGPLPEGQSALTAKLQALLDRAGISPAVIDGYKGGMTRSALRAFERRAGLAVDGVLDPEVWQALGGPQADSVTQRYRITEEDVSGLSDPLPEDYAKLAELDRMGYVRVSEKLAERFHMDEDFLRGLNPDAAFRAGETISVMAPGANASGKVARIVVHKGRSRLTAHDAQGAILADYPVTVGSDQTPSPSGTVEVVAVAIDPTYSYNPDVNFQQGDNTEPLTLPPGPNGPVGSVWIDLSEPTYGLHGTDEPAELFRSQSHGCVRMTNWDARELADMVDAGVTVFFEGTQ